MLGAKAKLSMPISFAPSGACVRFGRFAASRVAASNAGGSPDNVESTIASELRPGMNVTFAIPRTLLSRSGCTTIGPGAGAVPGAGCGNAVDIAV